MNLKLWKILMWLFTWKVKDISKCLAINRKLARAPAVLHEFVVSQKNLWKILMWLFTWKVKNISKCLAINRKLARAPAVLHEFVVSQKKFMKNIRINLGLFWYSLKGPASYRLDGITALKWLVFGKIIYCHFCQ